jgi:hypothetical protein
MSGGNESVNAAPVSGTAFGLLSVNVKLVDPLTGIVDAPNAFAIVGGAPTTNVADAVFPVPPLVALTWPVVLIHDPTLVPFTNTPKLHVFPAPMVAPDREIKPAPVTVSEPLHTVAVAGVVARPGGIRSLKATPVRFVAEFGFVISNKANVVPFSGIGDSSNDFAIVGGATTVNEAVDGALLPPSVDDAVTELFLTPAVVPVTFTCSVQLAFPAMTPPASETTPDPGTAVCVPPQLPDKPFGSDTTRPAGRLSVKATPVACSGSLFSKRKLMDVEPRRGIDVALNPFTIDGG